MLGQFMLFSQGGVPALAVEDSQRGTIIIIIIKELELQIFSAMRHLWHIYQNYL